MNVNASVPIHGEVRLRKIKISFNCYQGLECTIDLCAGIDCGNGVCVGGVPANCNCDPGYLNIESNCAETCTIDPCQELDIKLLYFIALVFCHLECMSYASCRNSPVAE